MTRWYINDYRINPAFVTARNIDTPWAQTTQNIYGAYGLVDSVNREAKPIVIDISLIGSNRFVIESSIRAELEASPIIYIESSNKYIHKDKHSVWIVPTGMNVTDKGAKIPLKCIISGLIDERTIHSCDFLSNWSGSNLSLATDTRHGAYSVKESISTDGVHDTICTAVEPRNFEEANHLCLWVKSDHADTWFDTFQFGLSDGFTTVFADTDSFDAATWSYQEIRMQNYASLDESTITNFVLRTNPPSATAYWVEIAWVWME